jgi:hypothetical protein
MLEKKIRPQDLHIIVEKHQDLSLGGQRPNIARAGSAFAAVAKVLNRETGRCERDINSRIHALVHDDDLSAPIGLRANISNSPP